MVRLNHFIRVLRGLLLLLPGLASAADSVDWIVATVNDEAVLRSEVIAERDVLSQLLSNTQRRIPLAQLSQLAVENVISQKLQLQRADHIGVTITPERVDGVLERMLANAQFTSLEQLAARDGLGVEQFRQRVTNELRINEALLSDNRQELIVSSDQVNELLRARLRNLGLREYLVEHVHLPSDATDSAQRLRRAPRDDFLALARDHHIGTSDIAMGWRSEDELSEFFINTLRELNTGEVSAAMELEDGIHILRLIAVRPLVPGSVRQDQVRLQLITVASTADEQKLRNTKSAIVAGELDFADAAAAVSGQISVADYQVANLPETIAHGMRLRVGEIGGPFVIPEGLAIVQVLGIRQETIGDTELRAEAINTMSNIKVEELRQKWLEYLRSLGTVNIVRAEL